MCSERVEINNYPQTRNSPTLCNQTREVLNLVHSPIHLAPLEIDRRSLSLSLFIVI